MPLNKHLLIKLVRKGHVKTVKQLEAQARTRDGGGIAFSTKEAENVQGRAYKDSTRASEAIRSKSPFDPSRLKSGRTKFFTYGGEICSEQPFRQRIMRKK